MTFFLEWIVKKMSRKKIFKFFILSLLLLKLIENKLSMFVAPAEKGNYCLHQDCKRSHSTNMITNRTWIVDVS